MTRLDTRWTWASRCAAAIHYAYNSSTPAVQAWVRASAGMQVVPVDATHACAQVYNLTTYPNLVGLFEALGVDTAPSDMSFAVSMDGGALEWGSRGLGAVFAQRWNLLSPPFLRMVWDVLRFGREAPLVRCLPVEGWYRSRSLEGVVACHGKFACCSPCSIMSMRNSIACVDGRW